LIYLWVHRGKYEITAPDRFRKGLEAVGAQRVPERGRWLLPPFVRLHHLQALDEVEVMTGDDVEVIEDDFARRLAIREMKDVELEGVSLLLDAYQRVGAYFLAETGRTILADDLGLGKTAQAIAAADLAGAERVLVIASKDLLGHWTKEIKKFSVEPEVERYTVESDGLPGARFVPTNYACCLYRGDVLRQGGWDAVIVDEATLIKSRKAKRTQAIWNLARGSRYCWLLTGTLIRNHVDELWSLLHCLYPKMYSSYWRFRKRVCLEEPVYGPGGVVVTDKVVGVKDPELLQAELKPFVLARSKGLLGLPPISHETVWVEMNEEQKRIYAELKAAGAAEVGGKVIVPKNALGLLLRLREAACDPRIMGEDTPGTKTRTVLRLLRYLLERDHQILVFTGWSRYARLLHQDCKEQGLSTALYYGDTPDKQREQLLERFERKELPVMIATYQTAGKGLNLQSADVVVWLDRPWVPEDIDQAEGRVWRRGQDKEVHVYSVLSENSVEEYVETVLDGKLTAYEAVRAVQEVVK